MNKIFSLHKAPLLFVVITLVTVAVHLGSFDVSHNGLKPKSQTHKIIRETPVKNNHKIDNAIKNGSLSGKKALFYHLEGKK